MTEHVGFAVYCEAENGYLVQSSPSLYIWDPSAALLYPSAGQAWTSAKRRKWGAIAVSIVRDEEGSLYHEELQLPMKAAIGSWIVRIEDGSIPYGPVYISTLSKDGAFRASTEIQDARGFSHEKALELAAIFQGKPNQSAIVIQVSAEQQPAATRGN